MSSGLQRSDVTSLTLFHPSVREWFDTAFGSPTRAQQLGWPAIAKGDWTLIFAPTGSGKTLAAFLWCLERLLFAPPPEKERRCRAIYISPLKALAVDVERNLRVPLAGIAEVAARRGERLSMPSIAIRTGDTPSSERNRFRRDPADILITTPESLYLMLTSGVRDVLRGVETVVIDEIHALVPNKRGAHLALSLERLERLTARPPQRIGLSATQRPLEEVARFLCGAGEDRSVVIVDTAEKKQLSLRVEVPVEEMARLTGEDAESRHSIWPAIHPRLLELIRAHRSTLLFVNSRRLAERLAAALNELAGETLVQAHHGSIARAQRTEIEENLKSGRLPALVATSSLELGIDMGAIDLVIQIESPPSIASGMQRIGRASHQVGSVSSGIIVPKYRGDLLACAAVTDAMHRGAIEPTRIPRNPLDVLAQQIVAMVAADDWNADELFAAVRRAAPFVELTRSAFDGVLDMLSGLYPSDEFAELRPRVTWDRGSNGLTARPGAKRIAITSGGTIPDRGLYGVFLAGAERGSARVGELDEEMVFESRVGETFLLGASTWRIEEITHDRVLVTPAPGQPGKMPFWKADAAERTVPFGMEIGRLVREVRAMTKGEAIARLMQQHDLDERAAHNFLQYLDDQQAATGAVPDDRTIVVERVLDDLGDWRVCVLTPFGGKIHAPWAMAVTAIVREAMAVDVETLWSDDGFIVRFPETDVPPRAELMVPASDAVEQLVIRQLGASSLFAAKFREAAARALLLPRHRPQGRAPLWQQRKRAYDLLQVASRFGSFPIILEAYREVLRDVFDVPALVEILRRIRDGALRVVVADTEKPSPFAGSLLFRYVANFIYDGDAPLAERRAQALAIDQAQLRELLGEPELRELLDLDALVQLEAELQHLDERHKAKSIDAVHDLLLRLGDLTTAEIQARSAGGLEAPAAALEGQHRVLEVAIAGERRWIAAEDASRYRDALGTVLLDGIPERLLQPVADPLGDLVLRYARTHGPFTPAEAARRYGLGTAVVAQALERFVERGRVIEGEFRPDGTQREWCEAEVLRMIRRRSLAKLRRETEPVDLPAYGRLLTSWQHVTRKRHGVEALLETIEQLQGVAMPASIFESEILAARIEEYRPSDLDMLSAAGEIVWAGAGRLGEHDGRITLVLTDQWMGSPETPSGANALADHLASHGASFFNQIHAAIGGFENELVESLWDLVWSGVVTNDTFHALRAFTRRPQFRSRRTSSPTTQGRWSLLPRSEASPTERASAIARQWIARYGVVVREVADAESVAGGFSAVYPVLKAMEEAGRIRRGYFIAGLGATQFGTVAALDLLRSRRDEPEMPEAVLLAAADPANPYGALVKWPRSGLTRSAGASVVLVNGALAAYLGRGARDLRVFLPEDEPVRSATARGIAHVLAEQVTSGRRRAFLITEIDGEAVAHSSMAPFLAEAGFTPGSKGYQMRDRR